MRTITKSLLAATALAAVAIGTTACEVPEDDTASDAGTSTSKKDKKKESDSEAEPAAMEVTAAKILKEFEGNEAAADAKYKGQTLKVTGVVDKVDTEFWDEDEYVIQVSGGGQWAIWTVNCNDQSADVAASIKVKSPITVIGKFDDGGDLGIELKDCEVA